MSTALILRDPNLLQVDFTAEAKAQKETVLNALACITKVTNDEENAEAVAAQAIAERFLKSGEQARVECKRPALEYGYTIDREVKSFFADVVAELTRLLVPIGNYATLIKAKQRAAEQAQRDEITRLEREKAVEIATAKSHDEMDKIQEKFDERVKVEAPPPPPPAKVKGQIIKEDWEFEVTDPWLLARAYPSCVKPPEVIRLNIKALLETGKELPGVRGWKVVKTSVRTGREQMAIEV